MGWPAALGGGAGKEPRGTSTWVRRLKDPSPGWHMEAGGGLPGDGELDGSASSTGQGDLPQLARGSSWARQPRPLPSPSGAVAGPGHPWGMCQTITFLIEYLINYSGAKSIIHISFKRGGKSHCPLTEASQRLPRPWGLSHQREKLSQQECGIAPAAAATAALLPHAPSPGRTHTPSHCLSHTHTHTHTHTAPTRCQPGTAVETVCGDDHVNA